MAEGKEDIDELVTKAYRLGAKHCMEAVLVLLKKKLETAVNSGDISSNSILLSLTREVLDLEITH